MRILDQPHFILLAEVIQRFVHRIFSKWEASQSCPLIFEEVSKQTKRLASEDWASLRSQITDLQAFEIFSDELYFPAFWRSLYPSAEATFLFTAFWVPCCPPLGETKFFSHLNHPLPAQHTLHIIPGLIIFTFSSPNLGFQTLDGIFLPQAHCTVPHSLIYR